MWALARLAPARYGSLFDSLALSYAAKLANAEVVPVMLTTFEYGDRGTVLAAFAAVAEAQGPGTAEGCARAANMGFAWPGFWQQPEQQPEQHPFRPVTCSQLVHRPVSWCPAGLPQSTLLALLATIQYGDLKRMPADSAAWVLLLAAHARCRRTDSRVQACYQELKRSSSRMR